jgi:hypothetical protein|tara:strand:- start:115440 stop:115556 length:117 start_codon:yes stop_codon:yes gene_type:complete
MKHKEGDWALEVLVGTQRRTKDKLTPEHLEKLEALGFV